MASGKPPANVFESMELSAVRLSSSAKVCFILRKIGKRDYGGRGESLKIRVGLREDSVSLSMGDDLEGIGARS
jgi:hypothetical protein